MIRTPSPERPKLSKLEKVGFGLVGIGATALALTALQLTWEGMGGQHVPMNDMFRDVTIDLASVGLIVTGFGMAAVGNERRIS